jgi:CubicO group peptidase (beta-lactamase class C family)
MLLIIMKKNDRIETMLQKGVEDGVFPGAVLLASKGGTIEIFNVVGNSSLIPDRSATERDTIFDLASLTKPLGTGLAVMKLAASGQIDIDEPMDSIMGKKNLKSLQRISPRLLLCHSAGCKDWKPFYLELEGYKAEERKKVLREWIVQEPEEYKPGEGCIYSDLGFMLLEWMVEEISGMPMHRFLEDKFFRPLSLEMTFLGGTQISGFFGKEQFAATEDCPWRKRVMRGEVQDENAFSLGGYSGHAGLFGTAKEVHILANMIKDHFLEKRSDLLKPGTVKTFLERQKNGEGSTWALGWDTPSPENSSAGRFFSTKSVGHLGFTGTSLWMDLEKDIIVVFLTNRIHPTRNNEKIRGFRPRIHDLVMEELGPC